MRLLLKSYRIGRFTQSVDGKAGFSTPAMFLLGALCILAALIFNWVITVPNAGFFVDVPKQIACINDNTMHIHFPGYVPYHLLIALLAAVVGDIWRAASLLSLLAATAAVLYIMRACHLLAGRPAALCGGIVATSCILTTYFAASGASYMLDAMCASAILFHGLRNVRTRHAHSFQWAVGWFMIGMLLRPLSMLLMLPGLLFLVLKKRPGAKLSVLIGGIFCTALAFVLFSMPFYDSLVAYLESSRQLGAELQHTDWRHIATNLFRWAGYPAYCFHVWILYIVWQCIRTRKDPVSTELVFVLTATTLYDIVLLRYIPHAGYLCLLMPAIVILPMTFKRVGDSISPALVGTFLLISLCQAHFLQPLAPKGLKTAVANAYFFQYSKAGIESGRFETLSSELVRTNVDAERIPKLRRAALEKEMREQEKMAP